MLAELYYETQCNSTLQSKMNLHFELPSQVGFDRIHFIGFDVEYHLKIDLMPIDTLMDLSEA